MQDPKLNWLALCNSLPCVRTLLVIHEIVCLNRTRTNVRSREEHVPESLCVYHVSDSSS